MRVEIKLQLAAALLSAVVFGLMAFSPDAGSSGRRSAGTISSMLRC